MSRDMKEGGKYKTTQASFARDAGHLWNQAPKKIKDIETISAVKTEIRKYCKRLPISRLTI